MKHGRVDAGFRGLLVVVASLSISGAGGDPSKRPSVEQKPALNALNSLASSRPAAGAELAVPVSFAPLDHQRFTCALPPTFVETSPGCADTENYPACRWILPTPEEALGTYQIWRNTEVQHRSGRRALVSLILKTAAAYAELFPKDTLVVGDLDAPGFRHVTHDRGRDVDLYLPGTMWMENQRGGEFTDNYHALDAEERLKRRRHVLVLAQLLATCSEGNIRIYYNDEAVQEVFNAWFAAQGFKSPFGSPMQGHNTLHAFHFHVTLGDGWHSQLANQAVVSD